MVHPTRQRRSATVGAALLMALAAGCGNGVDTDSSNRGSGTDTEPTSVENAFIVPRFVPGSCAIQVGDDADLRFTASNIRPAESERLLEITTEAADIVRISPTATLEIPPKTTIAAGQPVENLDDPAAPDKPITVTLGGMKDNATPGKAVDVTFRFEKSGELVLRVPIEACPTQN